MYSEDWKKEADAGEFWSLVDLARRDTSAFQTTLERLDRRGLIRFSWMFEEFASRLGDQPFVDRDDPEASEDFLDDLAEEVVGQGRAFYEDVIAHPENMPEEVDYDDASHIIRAAASDTFFHRFGEEIPPYSHDY